MTLEITRFSALPTSPWRNGAGRKADIAGTADWNVGFAWLDADAPFSDFSGQDRTITLLDGPGFRLDFAGAEALVVDAPFRPAAFDGGRPTHCVLLGGAGLVLNAMTARARYRHAISVSGSGAVTEVELGMAEAVFVVLLAGTATVSSATMSGELTARDSVRVTEPLVLRSSPGSWAYTVAISPLTAPAGR